MAQARLKPPGVARDRPFKVKPLHPVLGCEIAGITLEQAVSPAWFAKAYEAFLDYQLILFRDVDLPQTTQVALARNSPEWTKGRRNRTLARSRAAVHPACTL